MVFNVCVFTSVDPSLWFVRQHEIFEMWLGTITAFGKAHSDEKFEAKKKKTKKRETKWKTENASPCVS